MDLLLNIDPVTPQHNLKGLRHLYDTVESQVRSLKALGVSADSYGSILSSVFVNKLPEEIRLIVRSPEVRVRSPEVLILSPTHTHTQVLILNSYSSARTRQGQEPRSAHTVTNHTLQVLAGQ